MSWLRNFNSKNALLLATFLTSLFAVILNTMAVNGTNWRNVEYYDGNLRV